jgi:hypothetical protein
MRYGRLFSSFREPFQLMIHAAYSKQRYSRILKHKTKELPTADGWLCRQWLWYISKHYPVSAEDLTDPITVLNNLAAILIKVRLRALELSIHRTCCAI